MNKDGLRHCARKCIKNKKQCQQSDCRMWIDFKKEFNCCLISIYENEKLTLREVGERLGISFARVKQIESKALNRLKKRVPERALLF